MTGDQAVRALEAIGGVQQTLGLAGFDFATDVVKTSTSTFDRSLMAINDNLANVLNTAAGRPAESESKSKDESYNKTVLLLTAAGLAIALLKD